MGGQIIYLLPASQVPECNAQPQLHSARLPNKTLDSTEKKTYLTDPTLVLASALIDVILRAARIADDQVISRGEFRTRHAGSLIVSPQS